MSKQMKREKKYSEQWFYYVVKIKPTQDYFRFRDINRTKQLTCETDVRRITGMKLFLRFTHNANFITQPLLLATFMQPKSVIHQREKKWRPFPF